MPCPSDTVIGIPLGPLGTLSVGIETLTTALSLFAAFYYYDKVEEDVDNMIEIGNAYAAIGDDYCGAAEELRERTACHYDYVRSMPLYQPGALHEDQSYAAVVREVEGPLRRAAGILEADDIGGRCEVNTQAAAHIAERGILAAADGLRHDWLREEQHIASVIKARSDAVGASTPNLTASLGTVAEVFAQSTSENLTSLNGALFAAGRGIGTLYSRYTGAL